MRKLDFVKSFMEGGYTTPSVEVCDIVAEKGFSASLSSGVIEDAETDDWGTL
jgi:hypothetical protein